MYVSLDAGLCALLEMSHRWLMCMPRVVWRSELPDATVVELEDMLHGNCAQNWIDLLELDERPPADQAHRSAF